MTAARVMWKRIGLGVAFPLTGLVFGAIGEHHGEKIERDRWKKKMEEKRAREGTESNAIGDP